MSTVRNEDIRWLDVSTNDALRVRGVQPLGHSNRHIQQVLEFRGLTGSGVLEGFAFQILHGNEAPFVLLADFVDDADVRVVQRRCRASLAAEAVEACASFARSSGRNFNATKRPSSESSPL